MKCEQQPQSKPINLTKTDFVTCVDLKAKPDTRYENVYQFIYGSQLYDTHFEIYAKFEGKEIILKDGKFNGEQIVEAKGKLKAYKVECIHMALINYKGHFNIGFTGDFKYQHDTIPKTDSIEKSFYLAVQGACNKIEDSYSFHEEPILIVPKGRATRFVVKRILIPLTGFKEVVSQAQHDNTSDDYGRLTFPPPRTTLFDSEYFERDGIELFRRRMPGMQEINKELESSAWQMAPGGRCNSGVVNLVYS